MKKENRIFIISFFILLSLGLGVLAGFSTWEGKIFFHSRLKKRKPSSLTGEYLKAIPQLHSYTINKSAEDGLLDQARVEFDEGGLHLLMGNFLVQNKRGEQELACNVYEMVEVLFNSGDMAVSGSPIVMRVLHPCQVSNEDPSQIKGLYIPLTEIYSTVPKEGEFLVNQFDVQQFHQENRRVNQGDEHENQFNSGDQLNKRVETIEKGTGHEESEEIKESDFKKASSSSLRVFFKNVGFTWPSIWYISSIRFYGQKIIDPMDEVSDSYEVREKVKRVLNKEKGGSEKNRTEESFEENREVDDQQILSELKLKKGIRKSNSSETSNERIPSSMTHSQKEIFPKEFKMNASEIQKIRKSPFIINWGEKK